MRTRIIVKLDIKPPYVVKPIYFEGLKIIGDPNTLSKKYYKQDADEIMYIDIVSSLYQRNPFFDQITKAAKNLFIPFGVGGAIRTIEDISTLFHIGADKVVINTYALENPNIIDSAVKIFGSQAITVNIEAKKDTNNWKCYTDGGKIQTQHDVLNWAKEVEKRGAGEILLQSIDKDGKESGFDLELCKKVVDSVNIPVIAASGTGSLIDIKNVIEYARPSGIAIATTLHNNKFTIQDIKKYIKNNVEED